MTVVRLAVLCALLSALVSCSSESDSDSTSRYREEILAAAKTARNNWERDVLSDGEITRDEYVESVDRYVDCVQSHGIPTVAHERFGLFTYESTGVTPENEQYLDECTFGTTYNIGALYGGMIKNPERGDIRQEIVDCFVASGLVDAYTVEDFNRDTPDNQEATFPFDTGDSRYNECMSNPQTHQ